MKDLIKNINKLIILNEIELIENSVYRMGSKSWCENFNKIKLNYPNNQKLISEDLIFMIENTEAGYFDYYGEELVPLDLPFLSEAKEQTHPLNKPFRTPSHGRKKYAVYTRNDKGNVVLVRFGDPQRSVKNCDPVRAKAFLKRMGCSEPGPRWRAKWWSCNIGRYAKDVGLSCSDPW